MKDSFNYASFSNALFTRSGKRNSKVKRTVVIPADEVSLSDAYQTRHYPPYLWQDLGNKMACKK